jgi:serine-type D-Ala-D-Ala carboxypeptidase (penicillin-binding protein 5/6)
MVRTRPLANRPWARYGWPMPRWCLPFLTAALTVVPASAAPPAIAPAVPSVEDAPIALLVDISSGQTLFAREADRRFMPASITKVMTTFVAFERMAQGKLFPAQITAMRPETFALWGRRGSTMYLNVNEPVTIGALLHGVTTVSANDGAAVLAEAALGSVPAWVAEMNRAARSLGMRESHFGTPNGWMDEGFTWTTARDLVTLASATIHRHPTYYSQFYGHQTLSYKGIVQRNHDPITGIVPGADGIKSGFTNQAGYGFLGSAERDGRRLVMVIASSPNGRRRNEAARSFMEWGFSAFDSRALFPAGALLASAKVQNGGLRRVDLVARHAVSVAMPRNDRPSVSLKVRYEGPLKAPIAQGAEVAELMILFDGKQVSSVPLVARTSVATATPLQRVFNGLVGWLPWS